MREKVTKGFSTVKLHSSDYIEKIIGDVVQEDIDIEKKIRLEAYKIAMENILFLELKEQDYIVKELKKRKLTYAEISEALGYESESGSRMRFSRLNEKIMKTLKRLKYKKELDDKISDLYFQARQKKPNIIIKKFTTGDEEND